MTGVGLLGCGTVGSEIAATVDSGSLGDAVLVCLLDADTERARGLAQRLKRPVPWGSDIGAFLATPSLELVVECASQTAVRNNAETALSQGKDMMIMSSGALADSSLFHRLVATAEREGCRITIPSGALGGIDAIRAVRDRLQEVTLTSTKPPRGLSGAPGFKEWESVEITQPQVVFDGPAVEAVQHFPANINVAATLSLAGIGPQKTRVRVIADPHSSVNTHEVEAKGDFGVLRFHMALQPHVRNPRTSFLTLLSALEALRSACSTGPRIGT